MADIVASMTFLRLTAHPHSCNTQLLLDCGCGEAIDFQPFSDKNRWLRAEATVKNLAIPGQRFLTAVAGTDWHPLYGANR